MSCQILIHVLTYISACLVLLGTQQHVNLVGMMSSPVNPQPKRIRPVAFLACY
jgi:hypothetical protein